MFLRFSFFDISIDEVVIHEEQPQSYQVEGDIHAVAQPHSLVKGSSQNTHGSILTQSQREIE